MTSRSFVRVLALFGAATIGVSCKDSSGPGTIGPPSQIVLLPGATLSAQANTTIPNPGQVSVRDAAGHGIANQTVTFTVVQGGGLVTTTTGTSDANGSVPIPAWTLGKYAETQILRASLGTIILDINGSVSTLYKIEVRFFGTPMSAQQQALFTTAANRIDGFIVGDVVDANAQNVDLTQCGVSGQPPLNEVIDDVVIYASIQNIDGPGKILAQSGPCLYRNVAPAGQPQVFMPAVGTMEFDSSDLNTITGSGSLQEVITHEMLHVLGFGVLWEDRKIIDTTLAGDPRYTGAGGKQGCIEISGTVTCATSVPVEGTGGTGTALSHWRETTFDRELMTGFIDQSPNPLSIMTIRSMADLGYVINSADSDSFVIPGGAIRASNASVTQLSAWERRIPMANLLVLENGKVRVVRRQ